jgi:hypothetical protein
VVLNAFCSVTESDYDTGTDSADTVYYILTQTNLKFPFNCLQTQWNKKRFCNSNIMCLFSFKSLSSQAVLFKYSVKIRIQILTVNLPYLDSNSA